ncbi:protease inhibitor I9 family protein [Streptomyces sp. NPDC002039]|uniref:protease inhibitor I9 family protein n=1 Tax=Streptomyces sp. NPDC002039 TaxID=3154660 RepID=UPI003325926E
MRRPLVIPRPVLAAVLLLAAPVALAPAAYADAADHAVQEAGERTTYIVTLAPGADPERVMRETGVTEARYVYRSAVRGFAADLDGRQLAALRAHPDVSAVERDGRAVGAPVEEGTTGRW